MFLTTLFVTLLQGKSIDIMDGIHLINSLKDNIILMRNSVEAYHDMWYKEALQLAIFNITFLPTFPSL